MFVIVKQNDEVIAMFKSRHLAIEFAKQQNALIESKQVADELSLESEIATLSTRLANPEITDEKRKTLEECRDGAVAELIALKRNFKNTAWFKVCKE